jgi:hypothetical protein
MKVNVEVDCTPLEARQFFGLPDVQPMQTAVMDKMQQQMMANIEKVSPESLIQSWFTFDPKIAERFPGYVRDHGRPWRHGQEGQVTVAIAEGGAVTEEQRLRPPSLFLMLAEARGLFELNSSLCCRRYCCARRRATGIRCWRCRAFSPAIFRWRRCGAT